MTPVLTRSPARFAVVLLAALALVAGTATPLSAQEKSQETVGENDTFGIWGLWGSACCDFTTNTGDEVIALPDQFPRIILVDGEVTTANGTPVKIEGGCTDFVQIACFGFMGATFGNQEPIMGPLLGWLLGSGESFVGLWVPLSGGLAMSIVSFTDAKPSP